MMRIIFFCLVLLTILNINISAEVNEKTYLLQDHSPHVLQEINKNFITVYEKGRHILVKLKKGLDFNKIPLHVKSVLQERDRSELVTISHGEIKITESIDPRMSLYLDLISRERIIEVVEQLTAKENRRQGQRGNQEVTHWLKQFFTTLGLETREECLKVGVCNVIGVKRGMTDEYVLIEAHLDSVGHAFAGADDNASGIAGLIEIARMTVGLKGEKGLIFFATNAEESGLLGAKYFIKQAEQSGLLAKIKFVLNMDMIGYNQNGLVDIETNKEYENEAKWFSQLALMYTILKPNITMPAWGSDHVPFLEKNISSILTIEHWNTKTPCYHKACDTADHLNYDYAKEIVRLNTVAVILKAKLELP